MLSPLTEKKFDCLKENIKECIPLVAFSGGVDSSLLAYVSYLIHKDKALAITAYSPLSTKEEVERAVEVAKEIGIKHETINTDEINIEGFSEGVEERCYLCKKYRYTVLSSYAKGKGYTLLDGSNVSDENDYRPGNRAIEELQIKTPLKEASLEKHEIREILKEAGISVYNCASSPCLATRFLRGEKITEEKLRIVDEAEFFLREIYNAKEIRVRFIRESAIIEADEESIQEIFSGREEVYRKLISIGFKRVSISLISYKRGSMNG